MIIRKSNDRDLTAVLAIYDSARAFMAGHGNPLQWGDIYPPISLVQSDIESGNSYVCVNEDKVAAVFYFSVGNDPDYRIIHQGTWLNENPYAVVHRIASSGKHRGAASFCLDWCFQQFNNLKIDTHTDNIPMQNLLAKKGFVTCGRIYLANGEERIAYQKSACI